jgi:prepilin-type N-terminal cleavage/methylation domain-containing protein
MRTVSIERTEARRTQGFTLAEVLVAIALIAAVGAILLPSINRHMSRAHAQRVAGDLRTVSDGIHYFYASVERLPANLGQLETQPATDGTAPALLPGTKIPADLARKWKGPYLHQRNLASSLPTGFGAAISSALGTGTLDGVLYATLSVTGLKPPEFASVDRILDGGDGASAGVFRYDAGTSTATYFSTPVR